MQDVLRDKKKVIKHLPGLLSIFVVLNCLVLGFILIVAIIKFALFLKSSYVDTKFGTKGFYIILIIYLVVVLLLFLSVYGAALMYMGRKKGFIFYATGFGLIAMFLLWIGIEFTFNTDLSGYGFLVMSGTAFLFIIIFATQLKHLN